jgi:predicted RND superfamily exporter protein
MYSQWLYRRRIWVLVFLGLWTAFSMMQIHRLEISLDFANFLPKGDPEMTFYEAY